MVSIWVVLVYDGGTPQKEPRVMTFKDWLSEEVKKAQREERDKQANQ
jgi:hypothetical protein